MKRDKSPGETIEQETREETRDEMSQLGTGRGAVDQSDPETIDKGVVAVSPPEELLAETESPE